MSSPSPLAELRPWLERWTGKRLVVWGDVVADRFLLGSTTRVSREAPALVLRYEGEENRPGGAGNAALNAASLGGQVSIVGYVGEDTAGARLVESFERAGIDTGGLVRREDGSTPTKTRVMAGGSHTVRQQILRIDDDRPWPDGQRQALQARLLHALEAADALLISDYGLGSVDPETWAAVRARTVELGIPVTLDSRFGLLSYPGVSAATPNEGEVEEMLRLQLNGRIEAIESAGADLLERLACSSVLITRGSLGMAVFERERSPVHVPIHGTDEIADVTGAGDTVIATMTLAMAAGAETLDAARLANVAAGLVVMKHGTATVPREELVSALADGA
jgi:rfaE bifunctional protein kinase chain/domain